MRAASDEVMREVYVTRVAERTGVPRETIEKEVAQAAEREAIREEATRYGKPYVSHQARARWSEAALLAE